MALSDLLAIGVASELIGLVQALSDPNFVAKGGWLQPIAPLPPTLLSLIERFSMLSVLWFAAALVRRDAFSVGRQSDALDDLKQDGSVVARFVALQTVSSFALSMLGGSNLDWLEALRDCYVVALTVPAFRFLYRQYFA